MAWTDNGSNLDFGFAFNNINFSDRVLKIEIVRDDKVEGDNTCTSLTDKLCGHQQKRRKKDNELLVCDTECGIEVKTINVSSIILAAKSPFFKKLFSSGMKESGEHHVTLRILSSEEMAFMDLIYFVYNNALSSATTSSLIDLLISADKFQVSSCIRYCTKLLGDLRMTCESALQFSHLPWSVTMADGVQPLMDAANKYLAVLYKDFTKFEEELLELSLAGIEAVLSNDHLQVTSEDVVYEFVLRWTRNRYPMIEKRREILSTRLASLIRFEYMTVRKLKEITSCDDFDPAYASKVVLEALLFKAESPQGCCRFVERAYAYRPVKVIESKFPFPNCIVYLDLKREELNHLLPSHRVYSEPFRLGGKWFHLIAEHRSMGEHGRSDDCFGLFLAMDEKESGSCPVVYEFSVRSKPSQDFTSYGKLTYTATGGSCFGFSNYFGVSWSRVIAPDSDYFINGVLYIKVEIAMRDL